MPAVISQIYDATDIIELFQMNGEIMKFWCCNLLLSGSNSNYEENIAINIDIHSKPIDVELTISFTEPKPCVIHKIYSKFKCKIISFKQHSNSTVNEITFIQDQTSGIFTQQSIKLIEKSELKRLSKCDIIIRVECNITKVQYFDHKFARFANTEIAERIKKKHRFTSNDTYDDDYMQPNSTRNHTKNCRFANPISEVILPIHYKHINYTTRSETQSSENVSNNSQSDPIEQIRQENRQIRNIIGSLLTHIIMKPTVNHLAIPLIDGDELDNYTTRSKKLNNIRKQVHLKPEYVIHRKNGTYCIAVNPVTPFEHQPLSFVLTDIHRYYTRNNEGNVKPLIEISENLILKQSKVLSVRRLTENTCQWQPKLIGQLDTFAKCNIPEGTILGQYIGHEMLEDEYHKKYKGTKEDEIHRIYLHSEYLLIENDKNLNEMNARKKRRLNKNVENKNNNRKILIVIDALSVDKTNPLLYLNDGRKDIERPKPTRKDLEGRINTEFVSCLVNGYPNILVRTIKNISKGRSVLSYYGERYKEVMEQVERHKRTEKRLLQLFRDISSM
eukprot:477817_1